MKLQELLKNIEPIQIVGDADVEVSGVNIDSRKLRKVTCSLLSRALRLTATSLFQRH